MPSRSSVAAPVTEPKRLNLFERYLSLWVGLCMVVGVLLGRAAPERTRLSSRPASTRDS